jgi:flavin-dependent dehydrogenase
VLTLISDYTLADNAKIAVIGGGPSGSFFSIFALKMAKMIDKKINVTIFEQKDFTKDSPAGCNRCGGVISEHLVQTLAVEGINLPPKIVQRGISSYVLHTQKGDVTIESPAHEKRIATVYRGGGPRGSEEHEWKSFDNFLLKQAVHEGAIHSPLRIDGIRYGDKPVLYSKNQELMEADLLVGAFGVNSSTWKILQDLNTGYKKPETTSAFISELELGRENVSQYFGSSIHFYLLPKPRNIKFAALIPKGGYVTLCILGKNIDQETVKGLLNTPAAQKNLPDHVMNNTICKCFPKLTLNTARGACADRIVVIGDAGSTRLFKDGIGAAYIMGKAAAKTAILQGVSKGHFIEHYLPVYRETQRDNYFGKYLYTINDIFKNYGIFTRSMVELVRKEQKRSNSQRLSSILWDTFTGNESYRNIFGRSMSTKMHLELAWLFSKALVRTMS